MRTTYVITLAAAFAVAASLAGTALAGSTKVISFSAKFAGTAVTKVTDDVADISATGTGTGTPIGAAKITGKGTGDAGQKPCIPWGGLGAITGAKGGFTFKVVSTSQGCGDEEGSYFTLTGTAQVLKGTGALKKAKGTLRFTGTYDRGAGTFSVKFVGKLAV